MIKSFTEFCREEAQKTVVFTFASMNPPHVGYNSVLEQVAQYAKSTGAVPRVYLSRTYNAQKSPLLYEDKIKAARKMFPKHARSIVQDESVHSALTACTKLYDQGFTSCVVVVESTHALELETTLNRYNGKKGRHGFYNFKDDIKIVKADGVVSDSLLHESVRNNDLIAFSQNLPTEYEETEELFNLIRRGMGLREVKSFRKHIQLNPLSETREKYVQGDLYSVGDSVVVKETDEVGTITHCGSNYVIVENSKGTKTRRWLDAVEKLEE